MIIQFNLIINIVILENLQNVKYWIKTNQNSEKEQEQKEDLDVEKNPQFNRYKVTQSYSRNKKSLEDDDNDIFSEEKGNLTMLRTGKKNIFFLINNFSFKTN